MKKILIPIIAVVASVIPAHAQNILVVDVYSVFTNLIEFKEGQKSINDLTTQYQDYLKTQSQVLTDLRGKAQGVQLILNDPASDPSAKASAQSQLNTLNAQIEQETQTIQSFYTQSNDLITRTSQQLANKELTRISAAVKDIADKRKATLVINSASVFGLQNTVVYANDASNDITKDVITKLNDETTAAASSGTATPAATTDLLPMPGATKPAASGMAKPAAGSATK